MTAPASLTQEDLATVLLALDDAAFYRETRSRVLESAVRRARRPAAIPRAAEAGAGSDVELHKRQAQAYRALAVKLGKRA